MHSAGFEGSPHLAADYRRTQCGLRDERGEKPTTEVFRDA